MSEDCPQAPGDGDAGRQVTLGRREGVGGGGSLEEEETEEHEDLGPDSSSLIRRVVAESDERSEHHEYGGPSVVQGERQVDEELVAQ